MSRLCTYHHMRMTTCPGTSTEDVQAMKWFSISSIFAKVTSTYAIRTPSSALVINQSTWNKCQKDNQLSMSIVTSRPTGQSTASKTGFHLASIANMIVRRQRITGPIIVTSLPASPENSINLVCCQVSFPPDFINGNTVPSRKLYTYGH